MTDSIGAGLPSWIGSGHYHEDVRTESVSGTVGLDLSTVSFYQFTLTGNVTFEFNKPSSDPGGNSFVVVLEQDSTGGNSITWPAAVEWGGGSPPGLSTAANDKHMVSFISPDAGSTWIGVPSAEEIA